MDITLNPEKVYVCTIEDYDGLKDHVPKLVGVDLKHPIDPQLILCVEEIEGWLCNNEEQGEELAYQIDSFIRRWQSTKQTHLMSHEKWSNNCILNMPAFQKRAKSINTLQDVDRLDNSLVLGNGPSIDTNMDWLKANHKDYNVIACWHVIRKLLDNGIRVDYVAHVDGVTPIFGEVPPLAKETKLVTLPTASHEFIQSYPDNDIYLHVEENRHCSQAVATVLDMPLNEPVYGTVVYLQCLAAVQLRSKSLTLIGVDLTARPGEETENEDAFSQYVNSLSHISRQYETFTKLYNASGGKQIPGFEDIKLDGSHPFGRSEAGQS